MDFELKQWRNQQHESDQSTEPKMPNFLLDPQQEHSSVSSTALPLFSSETNSNKLSFLSAVPDFTPTPSNRFPRMASYFSLAQWQELELQALIFRYMSAGADVPAELLHPIKKSFINTSSYYLHHYPQYQPSMMQSGYWARGAMDPEPGRCRRTDGKKWRCSRDVVTDRKYCEHHMHRGRNRSRKLVENPTPITAVTSGNGGGVCGGKTTNIVTDPPGGACFALSRPSSELSSDDKNSDRQILRCFFDDWPRSHEDAENEIRANARSITMLENSSSDVSLKLSTGNGGDGVDRPEQAQLNWVTGWGAAAPAAQMGGPLAEAFRSPVASLTTTSPTSVLHELRRASASETSYVST